MVLRLGMSVLTLLILLSTNACSFSSSMIESKVGPSLSVYSFLQLYLGV